MKQSVVILLVVIVAMSFTASAVADVKSLRGDDLQKMSTKPAKAKIMSVEGGIERSFKDQPPMVPHTPSTNTRSI